MKKIKNINLLLIFLLLLILLFNCFSKKVIENIENSCPTREEVKKMQKKINEQKDIIQQAKIQKVKNFCDSAEEKFEDLNNKVKSIINSLKKNNSND